MFTLLAGARLACIALTGGGLGCGTSSDVVGVVRQQPSLGTVFAVNAVSGAGVPAAIPGAPVSTAPTAGGVSGGATGAGATSVDAPIAGAPNAAGPIPPPPDTVPIASSDAAAGTVFVAGAVRSIWSDAAEPWPFLERLRDFFGTPDPNGAIIYYGVAEPAANELRRLGREHGFAPGAPPALVTVDDGDDQYDLSIWEEE